MKKTIIFLTIILIAIKSFGNDNDSIFSIHIQQNICQNTVDVVIENISNDTILLFTNFENFFTEFNYRPGFRILFYNNDRLFAPNWGELPQSKYSINGGRINIPPLEQAVLSINLPFLFTKETNEKNRLFIELELNYRYYLKKENKLRMEYFKSEHFELKNINKHERIE